MADPKFVDGRGLPTLKDECQLTECLGIESRCVSAQMRIMIVSLIALMVMIFSQPKSFFKTCNSISVRSCAENTDREALVLHRDSSPGG